MGNSQETIADIVAEMRNEGHTGPADAIEWVRTKMTYYADRLEAAHKREAGDCAKLREACANIAEYARSAQCHTEDAHLLGYLNQIEGWAKAAALAAPARNCDKHATEKEGGNNGR